MLFDLVNLDRIRRFIVYAAIMLVVLLLQTMVFSRIAPLGVKPMFVPAFVVAIGMFEGGVWGGVFGLLTGMLCDSSYHSSVVLFTLLFPIIGFFSGLLAQFFVNKRFFSYIFLSIAALVLTAVCQSFPSLVFMGSAPLPIFRVAFLQVLWSVPFIFAIYLPCRALSQRNFY